MSRQSVVYLTLIIIFSVYVNSKDFCGNRRNYDEPKGIIETNEENAILENCTWNVKTPKHSVLYLKINHLQLGSYNAKKRNCLFIRSLDNKRDFLNICSDKDFFDTLSLPTNDVLINLEITSESYLVLTYTSYIVNCSYDELLCFNSKYLSRKPDESCLKGMLVCNSYCRYQAAMCGDVCYDILEQRCDGILDCLSGEDELGCNPSLCPNEIQCSNETKCVEPKQICDKTLDCKNGYDESQCPKSFCEGHGASCNVKKNVGNEPGTDESFYIIIIILGVLAVLFLCMIFKCLAARQNVRSLLNNPLEIPLPPFRGPGEGSSTAEVAAFTDDDFKPGGEIYESFIKNLDKIKSKRKNILEIGDGGITFVKPPPGKEVLDKYFQGVKPVLSEELAALATLKISRDMCHGLRKTRSQERPMTKMLFIDNIDENISDDSDTEDVGSSSNWRNDVHRNLNSKSDTNYVRTKGVEITMV